MLHTPIKNIFCHIIHINLCAPAVTTQISRTLKKVNLPFHFEINTTLPGKSRGRLELPEKEEERQQAVTPFYFPSRHIR
jgi:hypothetical protein